MASEGPDSYPTTYDFKYISALLKSDRGVEKTVSLVIQGRDELGPVLPPGSKELPVAFEILQCQVKDGEGHESDHVDLMKINLDPLEDPFTAHLTGSSSATSSSAPGLSEASGAHAPTN